MRWTLAKAGLALFTASTLGMARPGMAQQSPYLPIATPTPPGKARNESHPYAATKQHQGMSDEIQVELAWLADPATFPCRLGAYLDGDTLKIRGFVPNEAIKMKAMEIAGQHTAMPLIDELRIYSNIPMPAAGVAVDSVLGDAAQALAKQLGDKANPLELTASISGQVVVTGPLPSLQDQLAVSHCLWGVHGCTSVKNLTSIPGSTTASIVTDKTTTDKKPNYPTPSKAVTLPETKVAVPTVVALPESKSVVSRVVTASDAKTTSPKADSAKTVTLPETKVATPTVTALPESKPVASKVATPSDMKTSSPKAETMLASTGTPTGTEVSRFKTLKGSKADASKDTTKETTKTITPSQPSTDLAKAAQPMPIIKSTDTPKSVSGPTVVLPPASGSVVAPRSEASQPATGGERKMAVSHETSASVAVVAPLSESNQPITGSERKTATPERKMPPTDAASVITADAKMKDKPSKKVEPVSHVTSAPVAKSSSMPEGAYVASGVITYEEPAPAKPVSHSDPATARLKDRIQTACGHAGKNVEVHASSGNRLTIKVQCATREEGERLSKQILELRELAPYEVSLDVKLVP
jgi:hypothetical protein